MSLSVITMASHDTGCHQLRSAAMSRWKPDAEGRPFASMRSGIIAANPELQERELIKLQSLAGAIATALRERGVSHNAAILAAQTGVTVFHVAFARWIAQDDPAAFRRLIDES